MGKRQIIIKGTEVKPSHIGEEVNIEDKALKIWHGYITAVSGDTLTLRDMRQKEHTFKLTDIKRVFMERVTAY
jgi:ribosome maturation factor RimP